MFNPVDTLPNYINILAEVQLSDRAYVDDFGGKVNPTLLISPPKKINLIISSCRNTLISAKK
ncbi:unnamed protein product [Sphenostylis stenocarpa]|uniref:Uncharacterized protein n=1 Tax=Sphenostylis stenocarpa TaxID=92480 RepID=A0AA86VB11_9FABA|nr:unnamed protein product [Sphenostylis stenocarpa]